MRRDIDLGDGHLLEVHELHGSTSGPTLTVLGGVHGDELEGVTACRVLLHQLLAPRTFRGTVRVVPVCNPPAFAARQRLSPVDGANLARVFPGAPTGTLTERLAHAITTELITGADLLIDLHSAGARYEMPVFAGYVTDGVTDDRAREATYAFGASMVWEHDGSGPGRTLSTAADLQIPSIYVEGSGGGGLVGTDLDVYVRGVLRVMRWLQMTDTVFPAVSPPVVLAGGQGDTDTSLSCSTDGFCVTRVKASDRVAPGDVLVDVLDDDGRLVEQIRSPRHGTVMMLRRQAEVRAGEGIAMLGPLPRARGVA